MTGEGDERLAVHDLRIADFGVGLSAALIAKQFADLGAAVTRIEPEGGDPFYDVYPAYRLWHRRARIVPGDRAEAVIAEADVLIVGGEDFPGLPPKIDIAALARRHPRLVILDITGYPDDNHGPLPAVDLLVQARTGVVYEQFSDRPIAGAFPLPSYGAALQGSVGAWVALVERERSGKGQIVIVSLAAGAAMFWGPFWMKAEKADAGFIGITPRDVRHLTLRCAGGDFLQLTMGVPGALAKISAVLGITDAIDPDDRGMPSHARGPAKFFGDVELLDRHSRQRPRADLLQALRAAGVPCEPVLPPGAGWADAQTATNAIIETTADGWSFVGNPLAVRLAEGRELPLPDRLADHDPTKPPLAGVRIVDFGIFVAGPYASKLLGDYGAEVIRVEPPSGRSTLSGERTIISANHGKRAICIDVKQAEGRAIAAELCREADIVLHNFRPGVADRLGLDRPTLWEINPALVTLETTAYGPDGPKALAPGFDMVIQAFCGLQYRAGGIGNAPLCSRSPLVDFATGAVGAVGLLVGLFERFRTGRAVAIDTNLLNVGMHMMTELVRAPDGGLHGAATVDASQTGVHPAESLYRTADGWIAVAARSDQMAAALADVLDLALPEKRAAWSDTERIRITEACAARPTDRLLTDLAAVGVWAERCVCDAWDRGMPDGTILRGMDDAQYGRVVHCIGPLIAMSRSPTQPATRLSTAPGADSRDILAEMGVPSERIDAYFATGVVR